MAKAFLIPPWRAIPTPELAGPTSDSVPQTRCCMTEVIGRFSPQSFALLRIVSGLMFALHGAQKILGWPHGQMPSPLPAILVVGGWIELVGGIAILIGLFTGIVAFICSGEMAVAY